VAWMAVATPPAPECLRLTLLYLALYLMLTHSCALLFPEASLRLRVQYRYSHEEQRWQPHLLSPRDLCGTKGKIWLRHQVSSNPNIVTHHVRTAHSLARSLARRRGSHGYASQQAARRGKRKRRRGRGEGGGKRCRGLAGWGWGWRANCAAQRRAARAPVARVRRGVRRRVPCGAVRRVARQGAAAAAGGAWGGRARASARAGRGLPRPIPEGGARAPGARRSRDARAHGECGPHRG
jgi:hypothetical protein